MSAPETFDAFYARTAWNVTSQMHSMTGQDSEEDKHQADHAVREAYARAYQQWYEVSGYRDPEAWVLKVAEDAYERRRAQGAGSGAPPKADTSTWPGIYRPRSARKEGTAGHGHGDGAEAGAQAMDGPAGFAMQAGGVAGDAAADSPLAYRGNAVDAGEPRPGGAAQPGWAASGGEPTDGTWLRGAGASATPGQQAMPGTGATTSEGGRGRERRPRRSGLSGLDSLRRRARLGGSADPNVGAGLGAGTGLGAGLGLGAGPGSGTSGDPDADAGFGRAGIGGLDSLEGSPSFADLGSFEGSGATDQRAGARGDPGRLTRSHSRGRVSLPAGLASRKMLVAGIAAVVVVAVGAYLAFGGPQPGKSRSPGAGAAVKAKHAVQMLKAGETGVRASVPWSLVGSGWTLAETSAAKPDANGTAAGPGQLSLYLVDPAGGKYVMRRWNGPSVTLLAWSGDGRHALLRAAPGSQPPTYSVLTLASGQVTSLPLKADVTPVGFTRPKGENILAIRRTADHYQLRRYDLNGGFTAQLSTMPNRQAAAGSQTGCPSQCNALSSLKGKQAVWGVAGNEMQLVSNTGGIIQRLRVTHSGAPPSCVPVSWWNATTVLANCAARGQPNANSEGLWLVPTNGATARALVPPSGSPSGTGFEAGAWIAGGHVYLTQTSTRQCPGAAPGPGGLAVLAVGQGGSLASVTIPGSKHNHDNVVAAAGDRLLVLAQTSCPGTSSLLSVSPSPLAAKTLLPGTAGELGVVAAAPYGGWSTAYSLGY